MTSQEDRSRQIHQVLKPFVTAVIRQGLPRVAAGGRAAANNNGGADPAVAAPAPAPAQPEYPQDIDAAATAWGALAKVVVAVRGELDQFERNAAAQTAASRAASSPKRRRGRVGFLDGPGGGGFSVEGATRGSAQLHQAESNRRVSNGLLSLAAARSFGDTFDADAGGGERRGPTVSRVEIGSDGLHHLVSGHGAENDAAALSGGGDGEPPRDASQMIADELSGETGALCQHVIDNLIRPCVGCGGAYEAIARRMHFDAANAATATSAAAAQNEKLARVQLYLSALVPELLLDTTYARGVDDDIQALAGSAASVQSLWRPLACAMIRVCARNMKEEEEELSASGASYFTEEQEPGFLRFVDTRLQVCVADYMKQLAGGKHRAADDEDDGAAGAAGGALSSFLRGSASPTDGASPTMMAVASPIFNSASPLLFPSAAAAALSSAHNHRQQHQQQRRHRNETSDENNQSTASATASGLVASSPIPRPDGAATVVVPPMVALEMHRGSTVVRVDAGTAAKNGIDPASDGGPGWFQCDPAAPYGVRSVEAADPLQYTGRVLDVMHRHADDKDEDGFFEVLVAWDGKHKTEERHRHPHHPSQQQHQHQHRHKSKKRHSGEEDNDESDGPNGRKISSSRRHGSGGAHDDDHANNDGCNDADDDNQSSPLVRVAPPFDAELALAGQIPIFRYRAEQLAEVDRAPSAVLYYPSDADFLHLELLALLAARAQYTQVPPSHEVVRATFLVLKHAAANSPAPPSSSDDEDQDVAGDDEKKNGAAQRSRTKKGGDSLFHRRNTELRLAACTALHKFTTSWQNFFARRNKARLSGRGNGVGGADGGAGAEDLTEGEIEQQRRDAAVREDEANMRWLIRPQPYAQICLRQRDFARRDTLVQMTLGFVLERLLNDDRVAELVATSSGILLLLGAVEFCHTVLCSRHTTRYSACGATTLLRRLVAVRRCFDHLLALEHTTRRFIMRATLTHFFPQPVSPLDRSTAFLSSSALCLTNYEERARDMLAEYFLSHLVVHMPPERLRLLIRSGDMYPILLPYTGEDFAALAAIHQRASSSPSAVADSKNSNGLAAAALKQPLRVAGYQFAATFGAVPGLASIYDSIDIVGLFIREDAPPRSDAELAGKPFAARHRSLCCLLNDLPALRSACILGVSDGPSVVTEHSVPADAFDTNAFGMHVIRLSRKVQVHPAVATLVFFCWAVLTNDDVSKAAQYLRIAALLALAPETRADIFSSEDSMVAAEHFPVMHNNRRYFLPAEEALRPHSPTSQANNNNTNNTNTNNNSASGEAGAAAASASDASGSSLPARLPPIWVVCTFMVGYLDKDASTATLRYVLLHGLQLIMLSLSPDHDELYNVSHTRVALERFLRCDGLMVLLRISRWVASAKDDARNFGTATHPYDRVIALLVQRTMLLMARAAGEDRADGAVPSMQVFSDMVPEFEYSAGESSLGSVSLRFEGRLGALDERVRGQEQRAVESGRAMTTVQIAVSRDALPPGMLQRDVDVTVSMSDGGEAAAAPAAASSSSTTNNNSGSNSGNADDDDDDKQLVPPTAAEFAESWARNAVRAAASRRHFTGALGHCFECDNTARHSAAKDDWDVAQPPIISHLPAVRRIGAKSTVTFPPARPPQNSVFRREIVNGVHNAKFSLGGRARRMGVDAYMSCCLPFHAVDICVASPFLPHLGARAMSFGNMQWAVDYSGSDPSEVMSPSTARLVGAAGEHLLLGSQLGEICVVSHVSRVQGGGFLASELRWTQIVGEEETVMDIDITGGSFCESPWYRSGGGFGDGQSQLQSQGGGGSSQPPLIAATFTGGVKFLKLESEELMLEEDILSIEHAAVLPQAAVMPGPMARADILTGGVASARFQPSAHGGGASEYIAMSCRGSTHDLVIANVERCCAAVAPAADGGAAPANNNGGGDPIVMRCRESGHFVPSPWIRSAQTTVASWSPYYDAGTCSTTVCHRGSLYDLRICADGRPVVSFPRTDMAQHTAFMPPNSFLPRHGVVSGAFIYDLRDGCRTPYVAVPECANTRPQFVADGTMMVTRFVPDGESPIVIVGCSAAAFSAFYSGGMDGAGGRSSGTAAAQPHVWNSHSNSRPHCTPRLPWLAEMRLAGSPLFIDAAGDRLVAVGEFPSSVCLYGHNMHPPSVQSTGATLGTFSAGLTSGWQADAMMAVRSASAGTGDDWIGGNADDDEDEEDSAADDDNEDEEDDEEMGDDDDDDDDAFRSNSGSPALGGADDDYVRDGFVVDDDDADSDDAEGEDDAGDLDDLVSGSDFDEDDLTGGGAGRGRAGGRNRLNRLRRLAADGSDSDSSGSSSSDQVAPTDSDDSANSESEFARHRREQRQRQRRRRGGAADSDDDDRSSDDSAFRAGLVHSPMGGGDDDDQSGSGSNTTSGSSGGGMNGAPHGRRSQREPST